MKTHPFTVIRGGKSEATPPPRKFAQIDNTRLIGDRMMERFFADRDKAIDRLRAQGKL